VSIHKYPKFPPSNPLPPVEGELMDGHELVQIFFDVEIRKPRPERAECGHEQVEMDLQAVLWEFLI